MDTLLVTFGVDSRKAIDSRTRSGWTAAKMPSAAGSTLRPSRLRLLARDLGCPPLVVAFVAHRVQDGVWAAQGADRRDLQEL